MRSFLGLALHFGSSLARCATHKSHSHDGVAQSAVRHTRRSSRDERVREREGEKRERERELADGGRRDQRERAGAAPKNQQTRRGFRHGLAHLTATASVSLASPPFAAKLPSLLGPVGRAGDALLPLHPPARLSARLPAAAQPIHATPPGQSSPVERPPIFIGLVDVTSHHPSIPSSPPGPVHTTPSINSIHRLHTATHQPIRPFPHRIHSASFCQSPSRPPSLHRSSSSTHTASPRLQRSLNVHRLSASTASASATTRRHPAIQCASILHHRPPSSTHKPHPTPEFRPSLHLHTYTTRLAAIVSPALPWRGDQISHFRSAGCLATILTPATINIPQPLPPPLHPPFEMSHASLV
ncbi:hypothetical protein L1887_57773 [Cichorium endivia]|nr:hypothetical protein L1887_57773 [Cichorium endivia]